LPVGPRAFLERFDRETAQPFYFEERQFSLRGSVGVAVYPDDGGSLDSLIESADRRMYAAKKAAYARLGG